MDKVFLYFPLCLLSVSKDKNETINNIISYCLVKRAIDYKYVVPEDKIPDYVYNLHDYDPDNQLYNKISKAAETLGIQLGGFQKHINNYKNLNFYISDYERRFYKDSYAAVGKDLVFDCRDNGFNFEHLRIICAINSIIGRSKKFVRITLDRIRYAMNGYKSKSAFMKVIPKVTLLSDKQLRNRINFLNAKGFFSRFTYANRQTYYSTIIETNEELYEAVMNSKVFWEERKLNMTDKVGTLLIKKELEKVRQQSIEQRAVLHSFNENKRLKLTRFRKGVIN